MLVNPLLDPNDEDKKHEPDHKDTGYVYAHRKGKTIQPLSADLPATTYTPIQPYPSVTDASLDASDNQPAIELIRRKVAAVYSTEPDVKEELQEAAMPLRQPSKHQQFMHELSTSGKSLAQIQTEWHLYYTHLPDDEKHEVWREFYETNTRKPSTYTQFVTQQPAQSAAAAPPPKMPGLDTKPAEPAKPKAVVHEHLPDPKHAAKRDRRTRGHIKKHILKQVNVSAETQVKAKQHFQSLLFGLGTGSLVLLIFLFGFFNEMFIAPFIQPSRHVSATPIIVSADSVAPSETPEVIIPKINVQIPVVYDESSIAEEHVQRALERGVFHYPTTVTPGQKGNVAIFGHSSNNIFNKGKYKFAFVLLHELVPGDIFYLTFDKKVYSYRVYDKKIVPPNQVSVLEGSADKPAVATLITCDPPGTSTNRLVVWGEQISPDPAQATAPSNSIPDATSPNNLPSEGPTLWKRLWNNVL